MSKIAEKRTNEIIGEFHDGDYTNHSRHNTQWVAFKQGYDQAMQDFMEKADKFFNEELFTRFSGEEHRVASNKCMNLQQFIEHFKNCIQNEI